MPSAVDFFPCHIIELMNFVTRSDPYTGSASVVRLAICPLRGISAIAPGSLLSARALDAAGRVSALLPYYAFFWRFVPYFERPWLRPATPVASSVPRTT